jgi:pimeloyl-ACP methyl ester carboxylesterase
MAQDFDIELLRGRLRARRFGNPSASGVPAFCVPGLSSNCRAFEALGERFECKGRSLVAFDLRGRGWSDITAPGTYGWENHALDILEAADAIGAERFDYVGHSLGAFVGMMAVSIERGKRIRRLVLVDGLGAPSQTAVAAIVAFFGQRKATFATADDFVAAVRATGLAEPWNDFWEQHYRYDLVLENGAFHPRTSAVAIAEDIAYASSQDARTLWPLLTVETLLLRATIPLGGSDGFVVTRRDYEDFLATVKFAKGVEIAANHYGIAFAPEACEEIKRFLGADGGE